MPQRKTKIVCTLGLASNTPQVIGGLIDAGMNVARFNFSHGTHQSHKQMFDILKAERERRCCPVACLLDTKGPEIRLGDFEQGGAALREGQTFTLHATPVSGDQHGVSVNYPELAKDVRPGHTILMDDGSIELRVESVREGAIVCRVMNGGEIFSRKGVNIPGVELSIPYLRDADRADLLFGIEQGFDYIAASFVRSARDVMDVRNFLSSHGGSQIRIIAKIENAQGVSNADEILRAADGIMVARGDMGVEIALEDLPPIQKVLIRKARDNGKIVITATQMLESMIKNPRPTRAETSDVANAIYDGTSAIMLSAETAAGAYPLKAVQTMARIALRTEQDIDYYRRFSQARERQRGDITNAISHATCTTAYDVAAAAIITVSMSGRTALNISKYRPEIPIIGSTTSNITYRQLALSWGVIPMLLPRHDDINTLLDAAMDAAMQAGYVQNGDRVVVTAGVPLGMAGTTNLLKVSVAGSVLLSGTGRGIGSVRGRICIAKNAEALQNFRENDILVVGKISDHLLELLARAAGLIVEAEVPDLYGAYPEICRELPVLTGVSGAVGALHNGMMVMLEPASGTARNIG